MKDEDQSPRQIGLCCAGEMFLSIVGKRSDWRLDDQGLEELKTLYEIAVNTGREDAKKSIRIVMENKLPWSAHTQ